jgi:hypothetical protein
MRTATIMGSSRFAECLRSPRRHDLAHAVRRARPEKAPARVKRDALLSVEIKRVFNENFQVYGVRKVWRQLLREGHDGGTARHRRAPQAARTCATNEAGFGGALGGG